MHPTAPWSLQSVSSFVPYVRIWEKSRKASRSSDHPGGTFNPPPWPLVQSNLGHKMVKLRDSSVTHGLESCVPAPGNPRHLLYFLLPLLFSRFSCLFFCLIFCVSPVSAHRLWGHRAIRNSPVQQTRPAVSSGFQCVLFRRVFWVGHFN